MPRQSKVDFKTEKGVRAALSSLARTMTAYSKTFNSDDDSVIAEQLISGVRDALGATYKKVAVADGSRGTLKSVRDKDVFDIVFKTEEKIDPNTGNKYLTYKIGDSSSDFQKVIEGTVKTAKKEETKTVIDRMAYRKAVQEDPENWSEHPEKYERTAKVLSNIENAYKHIDTLSSIKKDIAAEIKNGWIERDKTMSTPSQVKAIMVQRAKDTRDAELSDIDEAFKTVSQAIQMGEMEGLDSLIWHDGRQATMSDIQEILDAANRIRSW